MTDAAIVAAVIADMQREAGRQAARRWAHALGLRQALADADRRDTIVLVIGMLDSGHSRSEIRDRLQVRGCSRPTAYRYIAIALDQRRLQRETLGQDDAGIATEAHSPCPPSPPNSPPGHAPAKPN